MEEEINKLEADKGTAYSRALVSHYKNYTGLNKKNSLQPQIYHIHAINNFKPIIIILRPWKKTTTKKWLKNNIIILMGFR